MAQLFDQGVFSDELAAVSDRDFEAAMSAAPAIAAMDAPAPAITADMAPEPDMESTYDYDNEPAMRMSM